MNPQAFLFDPMRRRSHSTQRAAAAEFPEPLVKSQVATPFFCPRPGRLLAVALLGCGWLLAGCTTATKYKFTDNPSSPVVFRIAKSVAPLEVMIHTVIVYQGPGSWKQKALWDEYLVSVTNTGSSPLQLIQASLTDVLGQDNLPGDDPWTLEKTSARNWEHYTETGMNLAMGTLKAGSVAALAGFEYYFGSAALGAAALVAIPVVIVGVQVINGQNRGKVEEEFARRRLALPVTLTPGQRISGSLFFPQTPGPKALTFKGTSDSQDVGVSMDFSATPLSGLHMGKPKRK